MNLRSEKVRGSLIGIGAFLVLAMTVAIPCLAESAKVTQTAGVDNSKMGAYRALAQLCFQAFQRGDNTTAAQLARILERTWDAAEEGGGERSLIKTNKNLFEEIDRALDVFINPLMHYAIKAPDPAAVKTAYNNFLRQLNQGER